MDEKEIEENKENDVQGDKELNKIKTDNPDSHHREKTKESHSNPKKEDDEITFDFGKMFKKKAKSEEHKSEKKEEAEEDPKEKEFSFDWKKPGRFLIKNKAFFLVLIPILLMIFFRSYPTYLPRAGDCQSFGDKIFMGNSYVERRDCLAVNAVLSQLEANARAQVNAQYPTLPEAQKSALVQQRVGAVLNDPSQRAIVEQQIDSTATFLKSQFQDDNGYTYLADIDSYVWIRQAQNIVKNGHVGDRLVDGKPYNDLVLAPFGTPDNSNFHSYAIAWTYNVMHAMNNKITFMRASFFVPMIFSLLAIIAAYLMTRRVSDDFGGLIAGIIVAVHPFFLSRSFGSDTDVYNVFFPVIITWLFLEAFYTKSFKKSLILAALSGFFIGLFSWAWSGWWYVFDFILATVIIYILYALYMNKHAKGFTKKEDLKNAGLTLGMFVLFSGIFVTIYQNFAAFITSPTAPFSFVTKAAVSIGSFWPNVYTTVAELNPSNTAEVIGNTGGMFFFLISIIGVIMILWIGISRTLQHKTSEAKLYMKLGILLIIWYAATIYASTKGVRFVILLVPAYAVALGVFFGITGKYASDWITNSLKVSKKITKPLIIGFLILILFFHAQSPIKTADAASRNEFPIVNDAWYNALTKIKQESSPNAIVNSWWDFGHHFKYLTERRVTFDGGTQSSPQAHWIGKALLTEDEELSVGILKMLDCGANRAFEELDEELKDPDYTVSLLYQLVKLNEKEAREFLEEKSIKQERINKILEYSHCEGKDIPENYFITSEDMIGKSGVWGHFGSWDFVKAELWITGRGWSKEQTIEFITTQKSRNYSVKEAEQMYFELQALNSEGEANVWIAPWPSYATGLVGCPIIGEEAVCQSSQLLARVNLTTMDVFFQTNQGLKRPTVFVYPEGEDVVTKKYTGDTIGFGFVLVPADAEKKNLQGILASTETAQSTFTKLFFLQGHGSKYFDFFTHEQSVTGNSIYVWKVDWEGKTKHQVFNEEPILDKPLTADVVVG